MPKRAIRQAPVGHRPTPPETGVYVHFPWCLRKCPYCDFLSIGTPRSEIPHAAYADVVLQEVAARRRQIGDRRVSSVFFGGGTPSLWDPDQIGRVFRAVMDAWQPADTVEVTVECNPTSFDEERARALQRAGVNRVSIGVQGLDDARLEFLGRLHDAAGGLVAVEQALRSGMPRVSADFIFGVAGQTPEAAADEVDRLAALGLSHLSAYALTIEAGTQFGALAKKGRLPLSSDDLVAESFIAVDATLSSRGFEHYEISNYARNDHYARHNLGYWRGAEYVGLGCGAWGTVRRSGGTVRYRNSPSPERYLAFDRHKGLDFIESVVEPIHAETALAERLMLGLRLADGVDVGLVSRELGVSAWTTGRTRAMERLISSGRLTRAGDRLSIPKAAWLSADDTIARLM